MKKFTRRLAQALMLCTLLLSTIDIQAQTPELIFKSGFEPGSNIYTSGNNADIYGTDISTGMDWVDDLDKWQSTNPIQNIGYFTMEYGNSDTGTIADRRAELVTDPTNPSNQVLEYRINQATNPIPKAPFAKGRIQANMYNSNNLRDLAYSIRMFVPTDFDVLKNRQAPMPWMIVFEYWNNTDWRTPGGEYGYRFNVNIVKDAGVGNPLYFRAKSQIIAGWQSVWEVPNRNFEIPTGKWMTVRIRLKEGDENTGKFYMDVTPDGEATQVVFDITNYTHHPDDPNPDGFTDLNLFKLYCHKDAVDIVRNAGGGKYLHLYWDDFELWQNKQWSISAPTTLALPTNLHVTNITQTNGKLNWDAVAEATSYNVRMRKVGTSTWINQPTLDPFLQLSNNLTPGTEYEFQVEAINSTATSGFTTSKYFVTLTPSVLSVPQNLTVSDISKTSANFTWDVVTGATNYNFQIRFAGTTQWYSALGLTTNSFSVTTLSESTAYEVHVEAVNSTELSGYSSIVPFSTLGSAPTKPQNVIATNIGTTSADITWDAVANATSYRLQLQEVGTSAWATYNITTNNHTLNTLTANTTYVVRVKASNQYGASGYTFSPEFTTLTALPDVPQNVIVSNLTPTGAIVSWDAAANATSYPARIQWPGQSWVYGETVELLINLVGGLVPERTYEFQVKGKNQYGESEWSTPLFFTTPELPPLTPTNLVVTDITATSATASWDASATAVSYDFDYKITGAMTWTKLNVTQTSLALSGLQSNTSYDIRVRAVNAGGNSIFEHSSFTTLEDIVPPLETYCKYPNQYTPHDDGNAFKLSAWPGHPLPNQWKMWDPWVMWDEEDQLYKCWYTVYERNPSYEPNIWPGPGWSVGMTMGVAYAYSADGINWTRHTTQHIILPSVDKNDWDGGNLETVTVLKKDGVYYMLYLGYMDKFMGFGNKSRQFGLATSSDGINWTKHNNNPIIEASLWFEASYPAGATAQDGGMKEPSLVWDEEAQLFKLWYVGFTKDAQGRSIQIPAYATSTDCINWNKQGAINTGFGGSNHMFVTQDPSGDGYQLYSTTKFGIGHAWSQDGITNWIENPNFTEGEVIEPYEGVATQVGPSKWEWDTLRAYGSPNIVYNPNGETRIYYMQTRDYATEYGDDAMRFGMSVVGCDEGTATPTYCAAATEYDEYTWIANFSIDGESTPSTSSGAGYEDHTDVIYELNSGGTNLMAFTPGYYSTEQYANQWAVYIDYNADGDFDDAGELIAQTAQGVAGSIQANIPIQSDINVMTRLRIVMLYNEAPQPCGTFTYGEVEDYTIHISDGTKSYGNGKSKALPPALLEGLKAKATLSIYPNPSGGIINLQLSNAESITAVNVIDYTGRTVYSTVPLNKQLDLRGQNLPTGYYYIQVTTAHNKYTGKINLVD